MSLRRRLLGAVLVTVISALLISGGLTYALVVRSQLRQVDSDLERGHHPIERVAAGGEQTRFRDVRQAAPGFYVELRDDSGASLLVVPLRDESGDNMTFGRLELPASETSGTADSAVFATITARDETLRVRVSRQDDGNILVIGRSIEGVLRARQLLFLALIGTGLIATLLATVLGAWLVHVGLRPLRDVRLAASAIGDDDLGKRVPGDDANTEVGELARTVNRMLGRLEGAFGQLERERDAVQLSEARMRRFVADASHELRTPIAATAAYAELFERGARDHPDDLARAMSGIRSETTRMTELVEDLLLLAELDEGRPLGHGAVDVCELVAGAVDVAAVVDPSRRLAMRFEAMPIVNGDENRLRQVVDNLLANVRTHTPAGTECDVVVAIDGHDAVIEVGDDGPGMSVDDAALAFDRFHRADTSRTRSSGGNGLGLSIVNAIVVAHDGAVELDSEPGGGTVVRIRLPFVETESQASLNGS